MRGKRNKDFDIDLGLAVSALSLVYGQTRTQEELKDFCNCDRRTIQNLEERALRKLRRAIMKDPGLRELAQF